MKSRWRKVGGISHALFSAGSQNLQQEPGTVHTGWADAQVMISTPFFWQEQFPFLHSTLTLCPSTLDILAQEPISNLGGAVGLAGEVTGSGAGGVTGSGVGEVGPPNLQQPASTPARDARTLHEFEVPLHLEISVPFFLQEQDPLSQVTL